VKDGYSDVKATFVGSAPEGASDNTALVGAIIDNQGFESLTYVIVTGTLADADAVFVPLLEEGDESDLSDAASVADVDLIGTELLAGFTFADDDSTKKLGYKGAKRYTRLTITPANNTGLWDAGVVALQGSPAVRPAA
jgi:hypothetical protein